MPGPPGFKAFLLGAAAACAFLYLALASVPARFGKRTGAGYDSMEQRLCVLGRGGAAGLIVAGDSRAKAHVDPAVLAEAAGLRAIDVAENLDLGGGLATVAAALARSPEALASRPLLVISVSMTSIDDAAFEQAPSATLFNFRPADHARLALGYPLRYGAFLRERFLPVLRREDRHIRRGTGFACDGGSRLHADAVESLGFHPITSRPDRDLPAARADRSHDLEGARWRVFRASLAAIADLPVRGVVLFGAPIDSARLIRLAGPGSWEAQVRFSALVAAEAARHPGMAWWDLRDAPGYGPDLFHNADHLNARGARKFTLLLAERIRERREAGPLP